VLALAQFALAHRDDPDLLAALAPRLVAAL